MDKTAPICPTQPPVTDFTASATSICVGQSVTFTDTSTNIPSAWTWTLPGGTPNSSTVQNPTVVYNTPGTYSVTLQAANFNGLDTKIVTNMITVTAFPTITGTTPASRCDTGTVTLGATASAGTLNWYAAATGGSALGTGTSFTTPSISTSTTYYVETVNAGCSSARTAVIATVNTTPSLTSTTPGSRCDTGSVTLNATASAGNTIWYANATGGSVLASGSNFVTPSLSVSTTYYVEVTNGTCTSSRIAVTASIIPVSAPIGNANQQFCTGETVGLLVITSGSNIVWHTAATGGVVVPNNTVLVSGTTYYASQNNGTCESQTRLAVTVTNGTCLGNTEYDVPVVKLYPNPTIDFVTISSTAIINKIEVVSLLGQLIFTDDINEMETKIDLTRFASGTYLIRVTDEEDQFQTFKVIKK
jgi:PKD repeat protein